MRRTTEWIPLLTLAAVLVAGAVVLLSPLGQVSQKAATASAVEATPTAAKAETPEAEARLVASVNEIGRMEGCACPHSPWGGLPEKGVLFDKLRAEGKPLLVVDAGNAVLHTDPEAKSATMLRAMAAAGYQVLNLGEEELAFGVTKVERAVQDTELALVSTNVVEAKTGKPVVAPYLIRTLGDKRVAVLGVMAPSLMSQHRAQLPADLRVLSPGVMLRRALAELAGKADGVVVLAIVPPGEAKAIARIPGVDVVIGGGLRNDFPKPERVGETLYAQPKSFGEDVLEIILAERKGRLAAASWEPIYVAMGPVHPPTQKVIDDWRRSLRPPRTRPAP